MLKTIHKLFKLLFVIKINVSPCNKWLYKLTGVVIYDLWFSHWGSRNKRYNWWTASLNILIVLEISHHHLVLKLRVNLLIILILLMMLITIIHLCTLSKPTWIKSYWARLLIIALLRTLVLVIVERNLLLIHLRRTILALSVCHHFLKCLV